MPQRYLGLSLIIIAMAIAIAALIASRPEPAHNESAQPLNTSLKVSNGSSRMTTDSQGADLQPAALPSRAATSSNLNPQKAFPNYCQGAEKPGVDGCIAPAQ